MTTDRCPATIEFGDDYGDNHSTFHCQLEAGHDGPHQEIGNMGYDDYKMPYRLSWTGSVAELAFLEKLDYAWYKWACQHGLWHYPGGIKERWCGYCGYEEQVGDHENVLADQWEGNQAK